jgi:hypothetical protein
LSFYTKIANKSVEQFRVASEDSACSHILYAACHDSAYLSQLMPHSGMREKITLVQGAGWNSEFHQFSLNVTQFPTVFRWLDLPTTAPNAKAANNGSVNPKNKAAPKKSAIDIPLGPRQTKSWVNGSVSAKSSVFGGDGASSIATNSSGPSTGKSFGTKATNSRQSSQQSSKQPCKFFQKVIQPHELPNLR